ncbi:deoxyribodipyrimidine photo-lyase, partial [Exophiala viscosa]
SPQRILIYLLRRDLRLCDNPVFHEIHKLSQQSEKLFTHVLPLYVFAAQQVEVSGLLSDSDSKSPFPEARSEVGGFWRCGPHRAKFLAESVWDVKSELEKVGSGLVIRVGMLGQVVRDLLEQFKQEKEEVTISGIWMTEEEGVEEKREERDVRKEAEKAGIDFKLWIDEKYFIDDRDIPFDKPSELPDVFTSYRKSVEPLRDAPRKIIPAPPSLPSMPTSIPLQSGPFSIPDTYEKLESALMKPLLEKPPLDNPPVFPSEVKSAHPFSGGCTTGIKRVESLIASGSMTRYKDTRNGLLGTDFSTKLSAWLALGCITARQIHHQLLEFEDGRIEQYKGVQGYGKGENKGTAAVRFELLWRDYMRLCTRKFGPRLFRLEGFRNDSSYPWKTPGRGVPEVEEMVERFLRGETGTSLIDASQRELYLTGYTSNRARQNVASFLAKHLGVNWKLGAEWYESMLTDYDVSSNWGNWQYVAGVGNDPRGEARVFNPVKQACDYDPDGEYCKAWVGELRGLDKPQEIFQPWKVSHERRAELWPEGLQSVERPLKRIEFRVGGKGRGGGGGAGGGGGGGKYGGSSRPRG